MGLVKRTLRSGERSKDMMHYITGYCFTKKSKKKKNTKNNQAGFLASFLLSIYIFSGSTERESHL